MRFLRAAAAKGVLIVLGLGAIARADDLDTILDEGRICPVLVDLFNGGTWRDLSPTFNDLLLLPGFTFITTGVA